MDKIDKLFNIISNYNDYKIVCYKAQQNLTRLIYECLRFAFCYQIGVTQQKDWVDSINWLLAYYGPGSYDFYNKNEVIDFFHEGEALEKIYLEVVNFMEKYQGYKDLPRDKDTIYKFARDNICKGADESCKYSYIHSDDLFDSKKYHEWKSNSSITKWINKYKRGDGIKHTDW